jgi:Sulfotransferase family
VSAAHLLFSDDDDLGFPGPSSTARTAIERPVRVLCVGATGQSGSTLFSRMVGRLPGFVAVGEVGRIWDKGLLENLTCGCGRPFRACSFWSRVGSEAFGGWDEVDALEAVRLRDAVTMKDLPIPHAVALPLVLHPGAWPGRTRDLAAYGTLLSRVHQAIDRVTEGAVIVDSMKLPGHVYLTTTLPTLDARVAHLVRDPRGYAYSNTKRVHRQGAVEGAYRARRSPRRSALKWAWCNLAFEALARRGTPTTAVRYEDLVHTPRETLRSVAALMGIGLTDDDLWFVGDGRVELVAQHIASGSRTRLRHGETALSIDDDWTRGLSPRDRRAVGSITWPLRLRYGYTDDAAAA